MLDCEQRWLGQINERHRGLRATERSMLIVNDDDVFNIGGRGKDATKKSIV